MPTIQIHLTTWQPWVKREAALDAVAGVYVIAKAVPDNQIYIGKTWGEDGLRGRLRAFNRSALTGQKGHAGGVTYHSMFGANVDDLLFAMHSSMVIRDDPAILNAYILYAERSLIWEHVELHGRMPVCNSE
jgi:hypothetical protein